MVRLLLLLLLLSVPGLSGRAQTVESDTAGMETGQPGLTISALKPLYGIASYYAEKFNGRPTATGARYNGRKFTAACNRLPLGSWIRVTNLRNRRVVIVQVNDRLHPKNKRVVDLSRIAAERLGYIGTGLTPVKVELLTRRAG